MSWNPKYFILYRHGMEDIIQWPKKWGNTCRANLCSMLQEVLKTENVGSELKLILDAQHAYQVRQNNKISYQELEDYVRARTGSLHFHSKRIRQKALIALKEMGARELLLVDSYREVLLYQAFFHRNSRFPSTEEYKDLYEQHLNKPEEP